MGWTRGTMNRPTWKTTINIEPNPREPKSDRSEYFRRYYVENRVQILETHQRYREQHRDRIQEHQRHCNHSKGAQSMSENRSCASFLGVYVAERLLSHLFKNVTRMPINNPGFDFRCGQGYMVDVKSACGLVTDTGTIRWSFAIRRNPITDYFLCIAFDNRRDLNPLHYWLIPGKVLSHLMGTSISDNTLDKWAEYEKPIDEAIACCNAMKGEIR